MISVIISSYREDDFEKLQKNIFNTIGVEFEIIKVSNPGLMGICEAYNKGAQRANYDVLCFLHEDIELKTLNWGYNVLSLLKDPTVGLIGVAGSKYKCYMPSGWSFPNSNHEVLSCMNYIQAERNTGNHLYHAYFNSLNAKSSEVVSIDGLWFCTRLNIVKENPFDENTFKNFHCYDVDFSLQVYQKYKVIVTYEVLIEHFSKGNFNASWLADTIKLHQKWERLLPINISSASSKMLKKNEVGALYYFLSQAKSVKLNIIYSFLWLFKVKSLRVLGLKNFMKTSLHVLLNIIKRKNGAF